MPNFGRVGLGLGGAPAKTIASIFGASLQASYVGSVGTSSVVDGTALTFWNDSGPVGDSGRNAVQATANKEPFYHASSINGKPGVKWDTVNGHYKSLVTGTWSATVVEPFAVIAVVKPNLSSGNRRICTNASGSLDMYVDFGTLFHFWATNIDSGVVAVNGNSYIFTAVFNGVSSKTYVNALTPTATGTNSGQTVGTGFCLGDYAPATDSLFGWLGDIDELHVVSVAPSVQQISDAYGVLGTKYAITVGP